MATDPATSWLPQRHVTAESFRPEPWSVGIQLSGSAVETAGRRGTCSDIGGARRAVVRAAGVGTKVITKRLAVSTLFVRDQLGMEPAQKPREEAQRLG
jgi:hypothetical protein